MGINTGDADPDFIAADPVVNPHEFDEDIDIDTTDVDLNATFLQNTLGEGFQVDARPVPGLSIDIETFSNTAIRSTASTGLAAEAGGEDPAADNTNANIDIKSAAVIEATGNGIYAASYGPGAGNVTVTNSGVIGATFVSGFTLTDGVFTNGTDEYDLTVGEGYTIGAGVGGSGIQAISDGTEEGSGNVTVTNTGTIHSVGDGIYAQAATGVITISNLSVHSIVSGANGIEAVGGDIFIYNDDNSLNTPPIEDNPDGFIDAALVGIYATNTNGGNISAFNGLAFNSNSEIYAAGNYGIYLSSTGDGLDDNDGNVQAWNLGYIETDGGAPP